VCSWARSWTASPSPIPARRGTARGSDSSSSSATGICWASTSSGSTRTDHVPRAAGRRRYLERREYGPAPGDAGAAEGRGPGGGGGQRGRLDRGAALPAPSPARPRRAARDRAEPDRRDHYRIEQARLGLRKLELEQGRRSDADATGRRAELERQVADSRPATAKQQELQKLGRDDQPELPHGHRRDGQEKELKTLDRLPRLPGPTGYGLGTGAGLRGRLWEFVSGDRRESNTEGGDLPAIFGTVMMVADHERGACPSGCWPRSTPRVRAGRAARPRSCASP
jgi:hypothetical protein